MRFATALIVVQSLLAINPADLRGARDRQDRAGLEKLIAELNVNAQKNGADAKAQYKLALANSYLAEVNLELRMKAEAKTAAEAGVQAARRAVEMEPNNAEFHRLLGTLCGQVIPANVLAGLKYGRCAMDEVNKAIEIDPKSSDAWMSRGVGNYYLPAQFGGGVQKAVEDLEKAIELNGKSADAHVWLGVALRKNNLAADARKALEKALALNPNRVWAKQLLEKLPQ
ncbi:MAG: tetratricopeptide repeat protein [Bryobacteraceae bacterium]|nr:tetratricopeptide repeat protein [Bryobacteraceae bacterium]